MSLSSYGGVLVPCFDTGDVPKPPTIRTAGLSSLGCDVEDVSFAASWFPASAIATSMLNVSGFGLDRMHYAVGTLMKMDIYV